MAQSTRCLPPSEGSSQLNMWPDGAREIPDHPSESSVDHTIEDGEVVIRAVIMDLGGVLEITPAAEAIKKWETELALAPGDLNSRLRDVWADGTIGSVSEQEVHHAIQTILHLDGERTAAFMDDMWAEYLGTLNVELVEFFASLRPRYRTAILSNSFVGAREREQDRYQVEDMADLIIYSHEVGMAKPDPQIYRLVCERLDVRPDEAIFVDDTEIAIEAARKVGLQAIMFRDNEQAIAEIQAHLRGIAGAWPAAGT